MNNAGDVFVSFHFVVSYINSITFNFTVEFSATYLTTSPLTSTDTCHFQNLLQVYQTVYMYLGGKVQFRKQLLLQFFFFFFFKIFNHSNHFVLSSRELT